MGKSTRRSCGRHNLSARCRRLAAGRSIAQTPFTRGAHGLANHGSHQRGLANCDITTKDKNYTAHHDFGYSLIDDEIQGSRYATLLLYLNEGMEGGETSFPRWQNAETFKKLKVTPEIGKAVLFLQSTTRYVKSTLSMQ